MLNESKGLTYSCVNIRLSFYRHIYFSTDSAKISINDLENILETETPPQSPPVVTEDVFIEMVRDTGTTTVKYSKNASGEDEHWKKVFYL